MPDPKFPKPKKTAEAFLTAGEKELTRRDLLASSAKVAALAAGSALLPRRAGAEAPSGLAEGEPSGSKTGPAKPDAAGPAAEGSRARVRVPSQAAPPGKPGELTHCSHGSHGSHGSW